MYAIKTENSTYCVNTKNKTISGGALKHPETFDRITAIKGCPAIIQLNNGAIVKTSNVIHVS